MADTSSGVRISILPDTTVGERPFLKSFILEPPLHRRGQFLMSTGGQFAVSPDTWQITLMLPACTVSGAGGAKLQQRLTCAAKFARDDLVQPVQICAAAECGQLVVQILDLLHRGAIQERID